MGPADDSGEVSPPLGDTYDGSSRLICNYVAEVPLVPGVGLMIRGIMMMIIIIISTMTMMTLMMMKTIMMMTMMMMMMMMIMSPLCQISAS